MLDFIRIACGVPAVRVADVEHNIAGICAAMEKADAAQADVLVLPELAVTGYSCGDLLLQRKLQAAAMDGLRRLISCSEKHPGLLLAVGAPIRMKQQLLNCAVVIKNGQVLGIVPKTYLSASEGRWFTGGNGLCGQVSLEQLGICCAGQVEVSTQLLFPISAEATIGIELCEDLNAPIPPSSQLALNGANVILNLAASNDIAGKRAKRRSRVLHQSGAVSCIYAYCSAGYSESTTDLVYSGHALIAQNGRLLADNGDCVAAEELLICDCDLGGINHERQKNATFRTAAADYFAEYTPVSPEPMSLRGDGQLFPVSKTPFIPQSREQRLARCNEIFQLQVTGLKQRVQCIGSNAVIGVSGGLDSTLALLVAVEAMHQLGRPASDVYGVTMPCFGTSGRTRDNSWELMRLLGINAKEISIKEAVELHFADIGHDSSIHNATFENAQARERTQILMDYASVVGGTVIGTGDLSELALGWCTYNGDHMSMYAVNATVPKSLIPYIIEAAALKPQFSAAQAVLADIIDTPISPELLPPDAQGKISQQTEDLVGPYVLHDFFLYHMLRWGWSPAKIYSQACRAFEGDFTPQVIKKWLQSFYRRFFSQQFKRNCAPDGVKIGSVSLGPRGDWSMPSDAASRIWLEEANAL